MSTYYLADDFLRFAFPSVVDPVIPNRARNLPHYRGTGYIGGDSPDGLVTYEASPVQRTIDLFHRATSILLASTESAVDGTYNFPDLDTTVEFDVRARGSSSTERDLIHCSVLPHV